MKKILIALCLSLMASAHAQYQAPTEKEIQLNRACFKQLETHGCGKPDDPDPTHFRSCVADALDHLEEHCRKMMLKLYGDS